MKVLLTISSLRSGGSERVLTTLANHWQEQGWDIEVFVLSNEGDHFFDLNKDIKIYTSQNYYQNSALNYFRQLWDFRQAIIASEPDIVISFLNLINISTLIAAVGINIPVLISERNNFDTLTSPFWQRMRRLTYPWAKGMVVLSQYDFDKYHFVKDKQIIFNPLNQEKLLNVNFNQKEKLMIAVGSLTHQKGFDMLIQALKQIEFGEWKFLIIGEGNLREPLTQQIQEAGLEAHVQLIGRKENIFEYYKRAAIFVLSSRYEGFPNVLNEAMAHGCACVAFDCKTGPADIIQDEVSGLLVEAENIDLLAQKITRLQQDETVREKFFNHAMQIREKNALEKISEKWQTYIQQILNKGSIDV